MSVLVACEMTCREPAESFDPLTRAFEVGARCREIGEVSDVQAKVTSGESVRIRES